jgi:hypothetical protein
LATLKPGSLLGVEHFLDNTFLQGPPSHQSSTLQSLPLNTSNPSLGLVWLTIIRPRSVIAPAIVECDGVRAGRDFPQVHEAIGAVVTIRFIVPLTAQPPR